MTSCCFCGFVSRPGNFVTEPGYQSRCKSRAACQRRLRAGSHLKRPVRLALEIAAQLDEDTRQAIANVKEVERIARETRRAYYIHGLCTVCGIRPHSPGRPRCEACA